MRNLQIFSSLQSVCIHVHVTRIILAPPPHPPVSRTRPLPSAALDVEISDLVLETTPSLLLRITNLYTVDREIFGVKKFSSMTFCDEN
jgi:hypothetical protein